MTVEGYGAPDYQYSLDDGPRQASNVFENVSMGTHVIHVWDAKGNIAYSCEELIINEVMIIDYPHYFTPNGDGIHDTWNIFDLADDRFAAKIFIFDVMANYSNKSVQKEQVGMEPIMGICYHRMIIGLRLILQKEA